MTSTPRLPRPVRLAMWANAWSTGAASLDAAVSGATADDPPHLVSGTDGSSEALIVAFRRLFEGVHALAVLPTAGFLLGLSGPETFNKAAIEAGGAVLAGHLGLVPVVSDVAVVWASQTIVPSHHYETLREANFELRRALTETASALANADLRAAREVLLDELVAIETRVALPLPLTFDESEGRIVGTALQCLRLTEASLTDHAADYSASAAHIRTATLRGLDQAARRVLVAASAHRPKG